MWEKEQVIKGYVNLMTPYGEEEWRKRKRERGRAARRSRGK